MRCLSCQHDRLEPTAATCPGCGADLRHTLCEALPPGTLLRDGSYQV